MNDLRCVGSGSFGGLIRLPSLLNPECGCPRECLGRENVLGLTRHLSRLSVSLYAARRNIRCSETHYFAMDSIDPFVWEDFRRI